MTTAIPKVLEPDDFLKAGQLAELCHCDLKTIHNWVDKGKSPVAMRTPGRHLRFRAADVALWLAELKFPMPDALKNLLPKNKNVDGVCPVAEG